MNIAGTKWIYVSDDDMETKGMKCTVISGDTNPDWNGENDIKIRYEDGTISYMKLRRFTSRFQRLD